MEEENFAILGANVALNRLDKKVKLFNCALSDQSRPVEIELSPDNLGDHRVRLGKHQVADMYNEGVRATRSMLTQTLDEIFAQQTITLGDSSLMWVDVKGPRRSCPGWGAAHPGYSEQEVYCT